MHCRDAAILKIGRPVSDARREGRQTRRDERQASLSDSDPVDADSGS